MKEWTKIVSQDTEPMHNAAWGGQIWWLTHPAVTGCENLTTGIINIFPGQGHPEHWHDGTEEILYVLEGSGEHQYFCRDGSVKTYQVKKGDLMFMQDGQHHSTINNTDKLLKVLAIYTHRELDL